MQLCESSISGLDLSIQSLLEPAPSLGHARVYTLATTTTTTTTFFFFTAMYKQLIRIPFCITARSQVPVMARLTMPAAMQQQRYLTYNTRDAARDVKETAQHIKDKTVDTAKDVKDAVIDKAQQAKEFVQSATGGASDFKSAVNNIKDAARDPNSNFSRNVEQAQAKVEQATGVKEGPRGQSVSEKIQDTADRAKANLPQAGSKVTKYTLYGMAAIAAIYAINYFTKTKNTTTTEVQRKERH